MTNVMSTFIVMPNLYPVSGLLHQLALRGAISYGKCVIDKPRNIFFGQPIIDAHLLSEAQTWMGGALHPSVFGILDLSWPEASGLVGFDAPIYLYPVPLKEEYSKNNHKVDYAVNWIRSHPAGTEWYPDIPIERPLYRDIIGGNFMKYDWGTGEKEQIMKENTLTFADHILHHYNRPGSKYYWDKQ